MLPGKQAQNFCTFDSWHLTIASGFGNGSGQLAVNNSITVWHSVISLMSLWCYHQGSATVLDSCKVDRLLFHSSSITADSANQLLIVLIQTNQVFVSEKSLFTLPAALQAWSWSTAFIYSSPLPLPVHVLFLHCSPHYENPQLWPLLPSVQVCCNFPRNG